MEDVSTDFFPESKHVSVEMVTAGSGHSIGVENDLHVLGMLHGVHGEKFDGIGMGLWVPVVG